MKTSIYMEIIDTTKNDITTGYHFSPYQTTYILFIVFLPTFSLLSVYIWLHSFVEIDHEIFSTVILSLPLIQEGQLSVSGERMCTILVNRLVD